MGDQTTPSLKCACPHCNCPVPADAGVVRDGKSYCSETCAYECTQQTCVCVHADCDSARK